MKSELKIRATRFDGLTRDKLYELLRLRSEIFVVEQNCAYQDIDNKDQDGLHIIGEINSEIVAYTRCFPPGYYFTEAAIGRVLVKKGFRKKGYAHQIINASMKTIEDEFQISEIKLSGQQYLIEFYESHGFHQVGKGYLEDGIPHIAMVNYSKT